MRTGADHDEAMTHSTHAGRAPTPGDAQPVGCSTMTTPQTSNGRTITDADIEALADEAERGYDPAELIAPRGKRGRPTLGGAGPSTVESVRLDRVSAVLCHHFF
jgi:hypothetical protein